MFGTIRLTAISSSSLSSHSLLCRDYRYRRRSQRQLAVIVRPGASGDLTVATDGRVARLAHDLAPTVSGSTPPCCFAVCLCVKSERQPEPSENPPAGDKTPRQSRPGAKPGH